LKAEVGKGFMRTAIGHELVDPKVQGNSVKRTEGVGLAKTGLAHSNFSRRHRREIRSRILNLAQDLWQH